MAAIDRGFPTAVKVVSTNDCRDGCGIKVGVAFGVGVALSREETSGWRGRDCMCRRMGVGMRVGGVLRAGVVRGVAKETRGLYIHDCTSFAHNIFLL